MKLHGLVGGRAEVCGPETTLRDAADAMLEAGVGSIAVIDGPRLTGILTERDCIATASMESSTLPRPRESACSGRSRQR